MSARSEVAALLTPLLPLSWRVITSEVGLDKISTTVVRLSQQVIQRHPAAPNSNHLVEFNCRVTVPGVDFAIAEDRLDEDTEILLFTIDSIGGVLHWSRAEKVQDGSNLAYDITLTVTTNKPAAAE